MKILTVAFMLLFNYLDTLPKLYLHMIENFVSLTINIITQL